MPTKTVSSQKTTSTTRQSAARRTAELTAAQREEVARVAYQIWQESGCQHGRDFENWLKAEAIVRSRLS